MAATIRNPKWEFTFQMSGAPALITEYGEKISPYKVVVTDWRNRCKITVTGKNYQSHQVRSAVFHLGGYKTVDEVPQWLMKLIIEAGFPVRELEAGDG